MLPGKQYSPADILLMVRRRVRFIAAPLLLALYAALVFSSLRKDQYQSEMLIQVVPQVVPDSYVQSTVTMRTEDRLNALTQELLSRTTLERIVYDMALYPEARDQAPIEDIVDGMRAQIKIEPVLKTIGSVRDADSFHVRFTYSDPQIAAQVTDRLGGLFIDLNRRDRGNLASETDAFLKTQLAENRRKLEEQEARLERFREQNAGRLPTQVEFNMQVIQGTQSAIQNLTDSLVRDRERKLSLERHLAEMESAPAPVRPPVQARTPGSGDAPGATIGEQLAAAREDLATKRLRLKPEHPEIIRAQRKIQELEKLAATEPRASGSTPSPVETPEEAERRERMAADRAEIDSLARQIKLKESQEQQQRDKLNDYQRRVEQVPGVESEWVALTRDYDTQFAAYKDLLTKSEQANLAVELERRQNGEQFKVLDPARPPLRPAGIPRVIINAGGAAIGFVLGVLLAAFLELRDTTFTTGKDVLEVLQLPVVAHVPFVPSHIDLQKERMHEWLTSAVVVIVLLVAGVGAWRLELWKHVV